MQKDVREQSLTNINKQNFPVSVADMYDYKGTTTKHELSVPLPQSYIDQVLKSFISEIQSRDSESPIILDIAAGRGETSKYILDNLPSAKILVNDISAAALHSVTEQPHKMLPILHSADQMPYANGSVDFVHCKDAIMHFPNLERFFNELHRVVKHDGLCVVTYNPRSKSEYYKYAYGAMSAVKIDNFAQYLHDILQLSAIADSGVPVRFGPPFFKISEEDVKHAVQGKFTIIEEKNWSPSQEESKLDWYPGQINRKVVILKRI